MPGVDDLITRRAGRISGQQTDYEALPSVQGTIDNRGAIQDVKDERIGQNFGDIQGAIDQGFGTQHARTADTAATVGKDIDTTYGGAATNSDTAFGDARTRADQGFGAISGDASKTFGGVRDRINQGRDFALGTTARAFAPAMAATLRRVRMAGIDPNSPEAQALLQNVDTARGHAFDDSMQKTIGELNQTDLAEQANKQGLDLSKLSNDQALALQNAANKQGLSLSAYLQRTNQAQMTRDIQNELDAGNMKANIGNVDTAFTRGQDAYKERQNNDLISRGLMLDDFSNRTALSDKANANDVTALGLKNAEFGAGAGYTAADLERKDRATQGFGTAASSLYNTSLGAGGQASQNAGGAQQGFGALYQQEQQNSNLLPKFGAGLLTAAVSGAAGGLTGNIFGTPGSKKNPFQVNQTGTF